MRGTLLVLLIALVAAGCETSPFQKKPSSELTPLDPIESTPLDSATTTTSTPSSSVAEAPIPPETGLLMAVEQRFSDIPLPANARQIPERSYVFESGTLQVGRMVYISKAAMTELAQFYIKQLPTAEWTRESLTESDRVHMVFTKPGKRLDIEIVEQGVSRPRMMIINLQPVAKDGGL